MNNFLRSKQFKYTSLVFLAYLAIYLISWQFFFIGRPSHLYTPDWTAKHFLWIACLISCIPGFLGAYRFSFITLFGYIAGVVFGEIFGPSMKIMQEGMDPMPVHNGWFIAILTFFAFCVIGIVYEHYLKKRRQKI